MKRGLIPLILLPLLLAPHAARSEDFTCTIPDATFNQSFTQARELVLSIAKADAFGATETCALAANALAKLGDATSARTLLNDAASSATHPHPSLVWALVNHYRITSESSTLQKALALAEEVRVRPLASYSADTDTLFWEIAAFNSALYAAQVTSDAPAIAAMTERYCDRREGFFEQVFSVTSENKLLIIPDNVPDPILQGKRRVAPSALWPTAVLDPHDPLTKLSHTQARGAMTLSSHGKYWDLTQKLRLAHNLLLLGIREGPLHVVHEGRPQLSAGDPAACVEWLHYCRDRLLYEDRDILRLLPGALKPWYIESSPIQITAPTLFGPVSFRITSTTDTATLDFQPSERLSDECSLVEWPLPAGMRIKTARIDGRRVYEYDYNTIRMQPRPCMLLVEFE